MCDLGSLCNTSPFSKFFLDIRDFHHFKLYLLGKVKSTNSRSKRNMESAVVKLEKISSDTEYSPTKKSKSKNKKSVTKSPKRGNKTAAAPKQKTYGSKAAAKQRGTNILSFELWARIFYFIVLLILYLLPCYPTCMAKNNSILFSTRIKF